MEQGKNTAGRTAGKGFVTEYLLPAIAVAALSFILLNVTFMAFAGFHGLISLLFRGEEGMRGWGGWVARLGFLPILAGLTVLVLKSRLNVIVKAAVFSIPFATLIVISGILLYQMQGIAFIAGFGIYAATAAVLLLRKARWHYLYIATLVGFTLLIMSLLGIDI